MRLSQSSYFKVHLMVFESRRDSIWIAADAIGGCGFNLRQQPRMGLNGTLMSSAQDSIALVTSYYKTETKKPETGKTTPITNQIQDYNKEFKDKVLIFQDFNKE